MTDAATSKAEGPLSGLKVVDISTVVAGPFAAGLLGDYGAQVLKVEMPGAGDSLRALAPHKDGVPLWWKVTNRNKRGVTLDLRQPEGRGLFGRLITGADVLVENYRPGVLDRMGFDRATLESIRNAMAGKPSADEMVAGKDSAVHPFRGF